MELKGFDVGGCHVIAEDEEEALQMYREKTGRLPSSPIRETNLDDWFYYFELHEICESDHVHIYDRKYPLDGRLLVSLKRPFAKKYRDIQDHKKEVIYLYW
jgi:hypothetical protein